MSCRHLTALVLSLTCLLAGRARAEIKIVGVPGTFATLQGAVDAAVDGDILKIDPGPYAGARVEGKGLVLLALPGGPVHVSGSLEVRNLPAGSVFVLSGVDIKWTGSQSTHDVDALWIEDCLGVVQVQRGEFEGSSHWDGFGGFDAVGSGARVVGSPRVFFTDCTLKGAATGYVSGLPPQAGGSGLRSIDSVVALYDCSLRGGKGTDESSPAGGDGGDGAHVQGLGLFVSGSELRGGPGGGGDYIGCTLSGDGGAGLRAVNTNVKLLDASLLGGPKGGWGSCGLGNDGLPLVSQNANVTTLSAASRSIESTHAIYDKSRLDVHLSGQPGDQVWILRTWSPHFLPGAGPLGVAIAAKPWLLPVAPMGSVPASGLLDLSLWTGDLSGPQLARMQFLQALCVGTGGEIVLSGPLSVMVVNT